MTSSHGPFLKADIQVALQLLLFNPAQMRRNSAPKLKQTTRMSSLGFVGTLTDNHANEKRFDSAEYGEQWARPCEMDVPIFFAS